MAKKTRTEVFVLDRSVALAWFFKDEVNPYAEAVLNSFPEARVVVPSIWHLEVANALLKGERQKRSTEAQAAKFLVLLLRPLPVTVDDETPARAWSDILDLARRHHLSAYDAAYLELAIRSGLPLATLDRPLKAAARAVGVAAYEP